MKSHYWLICMLLINPVWAEDSPSRVTINFIAPENYTDVSLSGAHTDRMRDSVLDSLRDYLVSLAKDKLPQGQRLTIDVLDIDMAGRTEPWRTPNLTNTRFIRDIYPPKIKLRYTLQDKAGKTLSEQEETLGDLNYLQLADPGYVNNDPLKYEKTLLRRWFGQRFE